MEHIKDMIKNNEKMVATAKLNPIVRVPYIVLALLIVLLLSSGELDAVIQYSCYFMLACLIILAFKICIILDTTELGFTNKRVIGKIGWLNTTTLDAPLSKINDITIQQSFLGRILNCSTIVINTSSNKYYFQYVKNATEFKDELVDYIDKKGKVTNTDTNKYEQLEKLKKLLDDNVITTEEFKKEKEKILKF